ncbi:RNA polymerase II-associated protein 3 isoform X2 [Cephus cinctus]|uniref:RNA polymerase II-associated protein 3 n=1 Tax=Cephus cinctus TaxID=211228 RepID=A0AAJ7BRE4_CEPCN|nr:RNA polymerase II-associated protein 3 isoform X2 [Cephus cinctus]
MDADKSILLQKQVRDNSEDLQSEFLDLKNWEEQMKRKDFEIRNAGGDQVLPPVRSKKKKVIPLSAPKENNKPSTKRIRSHDYSAWDKFDVDKACKEMDKGDQSDESVEESLSKEELEKNHYEASKHKNEGNVLVKQQKWDKAVGCYSKAIAIFPYDAVFYANRALCYLKMDNLYSAEADCTTAVQLDSEYVKAYHRRATARMGLKQYREAKQDIEKILKLEPSNKEAVNMLIQVKKKIKSLNSVTITGENLIEEVSVEKRIGEKLCGKTVKDIKQIDNIVKPADTVPFTSTWILEEGDDVAIVHPIVKPPHQRSKKPLRRVSVKEIDYNDKLLTNSIKIEKNDENEVHKSPDVEYNSKKEVSLKSHSAASEIRENGKDTKSEVLKLPPVPKTAVQFLMNWKKNTCVEYRYRYLKQIQPGILHTIFQDSLESDTFSEILQILSSKFVVKNEAVFHYLEDLSQVKRFRALIMFMSNADKKEINILLEHCKAVEHRSEEEIDDLRNKYEI